MADDRAVLRDAPISVLIVDDSPLVRGILVQAFRQDGGLLVVGLASNGAEAVALTHSARPDVIVMDAHMPTLDGLGAAAEIMAQRPTPILMITGDASRASVEATKLALSLGVLALQLKPSLSSPAGMQRLVDDVKLLAGVRVVRHLRRTKRLTEPEFSVQSPREHALPRRLKAIALVSSTGGPPVLYKLLGELSRDFPVPLIVLQHINHAFSSAFVEWLGQGTALSVRMAQPGDGLIAGQVLCCPPEVNLDIDSAGEVRLSDTTAVDGHCPSGTVLFTSLAERFKSAAAGVVLTGMGQDGAEGLLRIRQAGGLTAAQTADSCAVNGMPEAAAKLGAVQQFVDGELLSSLMHQWASARSN